MYKKLSCLMAFVLLMALSGTAQALVFSDDFDHAMTDTWERINYQGWDASGGAQWSIGDWDGFQSLPDAGDNKATLLAYNYIETFNYGNGEPGVPQAWTPGYEGEILNGVLRIASIAGVWADTGNTGAFLYKMVEGDFVAEVEVVGRDYWWHHCGGLMARKANPDGVGANENWVYITHFPVWGVGNHSRNTVNGVSTESPNKGYPSDPYVQISREGNTFYLKSSPDGVTWTSLPGLEAGIVRDDLDGLALQVGIWEANYNADYLTTMDFDNFSIVPEPATIALLGLGGLFLLRRRK